MWLTAGPVPSRIRFFGRLSLSSFLFFSFFVLVSLLFRGINWPVTLITRAGTLKKVRTRRPEDCRSWLAWVIGTKGWTLTDDSFGDGTDTPPMIYVFAYNKVLIGLCCCKPRFLLKSNWLSYLKGLANWTDWVLMDPSCWRMELLPLDTVVVLDSCHRRPRQLSSNNTNLIQLIRHYYTISLNRR